MPSPRNEAPLLGAARIVVARIVGRALALSAAAALLVGPARGDDVYLVNGEVFAGVVAVEVGSQVRLRMAGGEMRLAKSQVARVVESESPYERYLARREALEARSDTAAGEWLDLARLALAEGLRRQAREAALVAARLDPDLAGLDLLLYRFDYVRAGGRGEWIPRAEDLARRGFVLFEGEWIDREERAARLRHREEADLAARARRAEAARHAALREGQTAGAVLATEVNVFVTPMVYSVPLPWFIVPPGPLPPSPPREPARPAPGRGPLLDLLERQPGSLIPGHLSLDPPVSGGSR